MQKSNDSPGAGSKVCSPTRVDSPSPPSAGFEYSETRAREFGAEVDRAVVRVLRVDTHDTAARERVPAAASVLNVAAAATSEREDRSDGEGSTCPLKHAGWDATHVPSTMPPIRPNIYREQSIRAADLCRVRNLSLSSRARGVPRPGSRRTEALDSTSESRITGRRERRPSGCGSASLEPEWPRSTPTDSRPPAAAAG